MSATKYFAIAISPALPGKAEKIEAVKRLKDYFEAHPEINTGDETYYPAHIATDPVIKGTIDADKVFTQAFFCAELSGAERQDVESYGFQTREVGPHAFSLYAPG